MNENPDEPAEFIDEEIPDAPPADPSRFLRRYFVQHNRQAVLLAFFSLVASAILWGMIYLFVYWFALVGVTVSRSFDLKTIDQINRPDLLGQYFPWEFVAGALVALLLAALVRRHRLRVERLRDARLYFFWMIAELLLAVPNVTFSIWGNLAAVTRLRRHEANEAWQLLQHLQQQGGRVSLSGLRQEIQNEKTLQHIVYALQIVGLVSVREYTQGWFLCLQGRDVQTLLRQAQTG